MRNCFPGPAVNVVRIRYATPADVPPMRSLAQNIPTAAHWSVAQYDSLFSPDAPQRIALIAESDSTPTAFAGFLIARFLPCTCEIENLVIAPLSRRRRIASSLIRAVLGHAQAENCAEVLLEVRESNTAARRLYEKIGFRSKSRRSAYYDNPIEDAVLYRFPLQSCDKIG